MAHGAVRVLYLVSFILYVLLGAWGLAAAFIVYWSLYNASLWLFLNLKRERESHFDAT